MPTGMAGSFIIKGGLSLSIPAMSQERTGYDALQLPISNNSTDFLEIVKPSIFKNQNFSTNVPYYTHSVYRSFG